MRAALLIAWLVLLSASSVARAQLPSSLPEDVHNAVRLLPIDIESLAGTLKPFTLRDSEPPENWLAAPDATLGFDAVLELNLQADAFRDVLAGIRGRRALWGIWAKRDQEVRTKGAIIELGVHPYESIAIIKFTSALPDELARALSRSSSVTTLAKGGKLWRLRNVAAAALMPASDMLILVTTIKGGDAMLDDLVRRLDGAASDLAFGDAGRAWSLTDLGATLWTIRRTVENRRGSPQDNVGRDWELFEAVPNRALFRNVKAGEPWRGKIDETRTDTEGRPATPRRILSGGGYADARFDCARGVQCFLFTFIVDALGIMVWI